MSDAFETQRRLWELGQGVSSTIEGVAIDFPDWGSGLVTVNLAGVEQPMAWLGPPPWPGKRVRVLSLGKQPVCAAISGSAMGTVQTTSAGICTVIGDDGIKYTYPHLGSAPSNGARVRLDHDGQCVAGVYSTEPLGSPYVPPPVPRPTGGKSWFDSVWGGNWRSGPYGGSDVTISDSRTAAYGWDSMIADTIPDSATVTVLELHLLKVWESSSTTTVPGLLGTHGEPRRPATFGDGYIAGSVSVAPGQGVVNLLAAGFGNAFKTGSACGVGFKSGNGWRTYAATARIYAEWS